MWRSRTDLRTDQEILRQIYDRYYNDSISIDEKGANGRGAKNYVPIDIPAVAKALEMNEECVGL